MKFLPLNDDSGSERIWTLLLYQDPECEKYPEQNPDHKHKKCLKLNEKKSFFAVQQFLWISFYVYSFVHFYSLGNFFHCKYSLFLFLAELFQLLLR
jgi:hypothetical protein